VTEATKATDSSSTARPYKDPACYSVSRHPERVPSLLPGVSGQPRKRGDSRDGIDRPDDPARSVGPGRPRSVQG
jgi:hypothetical protein